MKKYIPSAGAEDDILSDVMDEPNYNTITNSRSNDWGKLHYYDHLAYSEIHRRVQNDIVNNLLNHVSVLELKLDYTDVSDDKFRSNKAGTYGRADIYYANELTRVMYLWEVKPSSYRYANKLIDISIMDIVNYIVISISIMAVIHQAA